MTGSATQAWRVIVPVKGAPHGKSRLDVPGRVELSRAFARDTLAAVAASGAHLVVVTPDPDLARYAESLAAYLVADPGGGLNSAVAQALSQAQSELGTSRAAVLLGDLPALRAADLGAALDAAGDVPQAFVPDWAGSGTVLLADHAGNPEPSFGAGSAGRHEAAGYRRLNLDLPRLRRDVDVSADLDEVVALGCGPHTARALARHTPMGAGDEPTALG